MNFSVVFIAATVLSLFLQAKETAEFTWWNTHKVGSWVKIKTEAESQGMKVSIESTHTLLEITKDKAVVEQKMKITAAGEEQPEQAEKEEVLKDKEKNPLKIAKEGDEEIEVAGRRLKCHWIEGIQEDKTTVKLWISKEIPGGVAKGEMKGRKVGVMKINAVSWEKK